MARIIHFIARRVFPEPATAAADAQNHPQYGRYTIRPHSVLIEQFWVEFCAKQGALFVYPVPRSLHKEG